MNLKDVETSASPLEEKMYHVAKEICVEVKRYFREVCKAAGVSQVDVSPSGEDRFSLKLIGKMTQESREMIRNSLLGQLKEVIQRILKKLGWGKCRIRTNNHPKNVFTEYLWRVEKLST